MWREGTGKGMEGILTSNFLPIVYKLRKLCKLVDVSPISSDAKGLLTP